MKRRRKGPKFKVSVSAADGKQQRVVRVDRGEVFHVDRFDTDSDRSRRRFINRLADMLGRDPAKLAFLHKALVHKAEEADKAVEAAANEAALDTAKQSLAAAPDSRDLSEIDPGRIVRPERFIVPEANGLTVPILTSADGKPIGKWVNYILHADGRRERCPWSDHINLGEAGSLCVQPAILVELRARSNADERWELGAISRDTIAFAVAAVHEWWRLVGGSRYPKASSLLLVTDSRVGYYDRTWKAVLQRLSDVLRLEIDVCLAPPATYKWTRFDCQFIARLIGRVAGRPTFTHKLTVNLISASPSQSAGPHEAELDANQLESLGRMFEKDRFAVNLRAARFHGEWNYLIVPRRPPAKVSGYFRSITNARK
jgi:hypothetical protein